MKLSGKSISTLETQRGTAAVLTGLMMLSLISVTALAVDIGYILKTRGELQNVADGAALAAARKLGDIYIADNIYDTATHRSAIAGLAQEVGQASWAGGKQGIVINPFDIEIGSWNGSTFSASSVRPNAAKVTARRDGDANAPVATVFAKLVGIDAVDVKATAVAALSGQSTADDPGAVGISDAAFESDFCNEEINILFTEDSDDCAGWHTFGEWPADPQGAIEQTLAEMANGSYENSQTRIGDELAFIGMPVTAAFDEMQALHETRKGFDGTWKLNVAVFDNDGAGCGNVSPFPNRQTAKTVVGFATIVIEDVLDEPKRIKAQIICENVENGRGSSQLPSSDLYFGTMGSIPGLVQ